MEIKKKLLDQIYFGSFAVLVILVILGNYTNTGFSLVVIDNSDPNSMYPTYAQGDMFLLLHEKADSYLRKFEQKFPSHPNIAKLKKLLINEI